MTEDPGTTESGPQGGLRRAIGAPLLFAFIVGDTLGAGIYTLVGTMAADVGGALWIPLLIALVVALLTAGTYAELITKYPHAGGAARYVDRAFGIPYLSFLVGFLMMASGITTAAAFANAFAGDYMTALIDVPAAPAAVVFIILLTLINLRGVRESLTANLVASIIEVTGLVLVIVVAAIVLTSGNGEPSRLLEFAPDVPPLQGAFAASIVAFFSFLGFEAAANMAEEVRNPSKAYPRALFGAIATAAVVYLLIALGAVIVLPPAELAESTGPLLDVVEASGVGIPPRTIQSDRPGRHCERCPPVHGHGQPGRLRTGRSRTPPQRLWSRAAGTPHSVGLHRRRRRIDDPSRPHRKCLHTGRDHRATPAPGIPLGQRQRPRPQKGQSRPPPLHGPRIVPILAIIASIALLTQQTGIIWLGAAAYMVVGSVLFLAARAGRKREARAPR